MHMGDSNLQVSQELYLSSCHYNIFERPFWVTLKNSQRIQKIKNKVAWS